MIRPAESLLKYDNPVLVSNTTEQKSPKTRPLRVSPSLPVITSPVPPPPRPKSLEADTSKQQVEEILNVILPPREWIDGNKLWVQKVSSAPCTRMDVVHLQEQLDLKLHQRQARETGICLIRRDLYSQFFDELIRQVTINCAERGLLLHRIRDEILMTIATYQTLYESSVAFGMRKALLSEQGKFDMEKKIMDLENEKRELERQVNEQKAKCDSTEKREAERRQVEEKKHMEEIQFLKRTNQQLKTQLDGITTLKK
ncbi:axonemal dynein light intermediate polypeptide 1-like [Scleropages formosus]|uniref:axonemal dynein light intermediate polypeptide 1-like n=1 Tax=Scleropages formosus TaxID=113540 RepID=UPI000877F304|nr:axonemal dynein light intermediate polypeptide 1-like [Scleropages formosus]